MQLNINGLSDRELLEQVYATQVVLMRQLYKMKDFMVKKYNADFVDEEDEKDEAFEKLQTDVRRILHNGR